VSELYQVGDKIIYGANGVCHIDKIEMRRLEDGSEKFFYHMTSYYQNITIISPADNSKVVIRPILSKQQAQQLIEEIPNLNGQVYQSHVLRDLVDHYESLIKSYDCRTLAGLAKSIYTKKLQAESQNKKIGAVDERFLQKTEDLLFGELAVALEIPKEKVLDYISEKLN